MGVECATGDKLQSQFRAVEEILGLVVFLFQVRAYATKAWSRAGCWDRIGK